MDRGSKIGALDIEYDAKDFGDAVRKHYLTIACRFPPNVASLLLKSLDGSPHSVLQSREIEAAMVLVHLGHMQVGPIECGGDTVMGFKIPETSEIRAAVIKANEHAEMVLRCVDDFGDPGSAVAEYAAQIKQSGLVDWGF